MWKLAAFGVLTAGAFVMSASQCESAPPPNVAMAESNVSPVSMREPLVVWFCPSTALGERFWGDSVEDVAGQMSEQLFPDFPGTEIDVNPLDSDALHGHVTQFILPRIAGLSVPSASTTPAPSPDASDPNYSFGKGPLHATQTAFAGTATANDQIQEAASGTSTEEATQSLSASTENRERALASLEALRRMPMPDSSQAEDVAGCVSRGAHRFQHLSDRFMIVAAEFRPPASTEPFATDVDLHGTQMVLVQFCVEAEKCAAYRKTWSTTLKELGAQPTWYSPDEHAAGIFGGIRQ